MIKIATDTISDLPADLVNKHQIHIIPTWLYLKTGKVRTDQFAAQELYTILTEEPNIPRTEPLSEAEYSAVFSDLVGPDDTLIVVSASQRISRMMEFAGTAAQMVAQQRITIHDSGGVSLWQGFQALRAAQMAAEGQNAEVILGTLNRMRRQSHLFFVLDDLAHLQQGGRVNAAQYMLGLVFGVKPLLAMHEGEIVPVGRVRGRERGAIEMQSRILDALKGVLNVWVGVIHSKAPDAAGRLAQQMQSTLRPSYLLTVDCGPTIAAHAGPGALGVCVVPC